MKSEAAKTSRGIVRLETKTIQNLVSTTIWCYIKLGTSW